MHAYAPEDVLEGGEFKVLDTDIIIVTKAALKTVEKMKLYVYNRAAQGGRYMFPFPWNGRYFAT